MVTLDVVCPEGVAEGELISIQHEGQNFEVSVPPGVEPGGSFQVDLGESDRGRLGDNIAGYVQPDEAFKDYVGERARSELVMDKFVAWFESENIDDVFEEFIKNNAQALYGHEGTDGEQNHAWYELYLQYQKIFEELLQSFLDTAGATVETFMAGAQQATGMNEIYLQIFLAQSEYEMFVNLMQDKAQKQRGERCLIAPL